MTARHEAQALVELGRAVIDRAWSYQTTWAALTVGKVPAELRREVLDSRFDLQRTESIDRVEAWDGSQAPLVIVGDVGQGKSLAAAAWLRDRAVRGQSIAWVSGMEFGRLPFDRDKKREEDRALVTLGDEERRAIKACATVIDDLGAGALSMTVLGRVKSIILEREAAGLPTLVLINRNKKLEGWIRSLIDARVSDRMRGGGSGIVYLEPTGSLRGSRQRADDPDPETGRGKAWKASAALLKTIGVLDDYDGEQWDPESRRSVLRPEFGHAITRCHCHQPDWHDLLGKLCRAMSLDVGAVRARGAELERDEQRRMQQAEGMAVDLADSRGTVIGLGGFVDRLAQEIDAEGDARFGGVMHVGQAIAPRPRLRAEGPEPSFAPGERQRLAALGYKVMYSAVNDEHQLRHRPSRRATRGDPKPKDWLEKKIHKHGRLLGVYATENRAWAAARDMQRDPEFKIAQ